MTFPIFKSTNLLLFFTCLIHFSFAQEYRDWNTFPAIVQADTDATIYVVGDVHGDYNRLINLLEGTKLISTGTQPIRWEAGQSTVVFTGDLIDKWPQAVSVLLLIMDLQSQAKAAGGQIIVTTGNHEVEFLAEANDLPCRAECDKQCRSNFKKSQDFVDELVARGINPQDVAKGCDSLGLGQFMRTWPFAARVNDWFFVHAGLEEEITLSDLDDKIRTQVNKDGMEAKVLLRDKAKKGILGVRMKRTKNWWNPDKKDNGNPKELRRLIFSLSETNMPIRHLAFGHQAGEYKISTEPNEVTRPKGTVFQVFDGLTVLEDVGMSRGVDPDENNSAMLRITGNHPETLDVLFPDGRVERLWPE